MTLFPNVYAVCRLDPEDEVPGWAWAGAFSSVTRTGEELSVVCSQKAVPPGARCERGWRALRVSGPLDFSEVGILAGLTAPLAAAGVSVFAVSTFDTDYLLIREKDLPAAIEALSGSGWEASGPVPMRDERD